LSQGSYTRALPVVDPQLSAAGAPGAVTQVLEVVLCSADLGRTRGWQGAAAGGAAAAREEGGAPGGAGCGAEAGKVVGYHYSGWDRRGGELIYVSKSRRASSRHERACSGEAEDEAEEEEEEEEELCTLLCHGNSISLVLGEGSENVKRETGAETPVEAGGGSCVYSYVRYINADADPCAVAAAGSGSEGGSMLGCRGQPGSGELEQRPEPVRFDIRVRRACASMCQPATPRPLARWSSLSLAKPLVAQVGRSGVSMAAEMCEQVRYAVMSPDSAPTHSEAAPAAAEDEDTFTTTECESDGSGVYLALPSRLPSRLTRPISRSRCPAES